MSEDRLYRIENKLDKLAEAVVSLARMEERMVTLFNRMDNYEAKQAGLEGRVRDIETAVQSSNSRIGFAERIFWIVLSAAVGGGFWFLK